MVQASVHNREGYHFEKCHTRFLLLVEYSVEHYMCHKLTSIKCSKNS